MNNFFSSSDVLNSEINVLKNEIQELLNVNATENRPLIEEKKLQLEKKSKELKTQKDYKRVLSINNSIDYKGVKDSEKMKIKIQEKNQLDIDYVEIKKIQELYQTCDSKELPSFLFFDEELLKSYGTSYYNMIPTQRDGESKEKLDAFFNKRRVWIQQQHDCGKLYFDLYNRLCNECFLKQYTLQKTDIESYFEHVILNICNDKQIELYNESIEILKVYLNCKVKTKKVKSSYNIVINNLSLLFSETGLKIHEFLYKKFDHFIVINNLAGLESSSAFDFTVKEFNNKLLEYSEIIDKKNQEFKFITNTTNKLKNELYNYIVNIGKGVNTNINVKTQVIQAGNPEYIKNGKYKKWSELKDTEIKERFKSFSVFHVNKFLLTTHIIDEEDTQKYIDVLYELLIENYTSKQLKYKTIKWDTKVGYISSISNLKYDNENKKYYLNVQKANSENNTSISNSKSRCSARKNNSIFDNNTKIINEQLIRFILKNLYESGKTETEILDADNTVSLMKNDFLQVVKSKLNVKRISVKDKQKIFEIFDEMYTILLEDQDQENEE